MKDGLYSLPFGGLKLITTVADKHCKATISVGYNTGRYAMNGEEKKAELAKGTGSTKDPWAHRSSQMSCSTCMWFVRKDSAPGGSRTIGRCRKHAPTMNGYPVVFTHDWCGDHKLDENANIT